MGNDVSVMHYSVDGVDSCVDILRESRVGQSRTAVVMDNGCFVVLGFESDGCDDR